MPQCRFDTDTAFLRSLCLEMAKRLREPKAPTQMQQEKALTARIALFYPDSGLYCMTYVLHKSLILKRKTLALGAILT
jgi:hypothetical protein